MTNTQKHCARAGFSLMEILIAITILGLVMAMVGPSLQNMLRKGKIGTTKTTLRSFKNAIETYQMDIGQLPQTLKDLIKKPRDEKAAKKWTVAYINKEEIPEDPFDNPFVYKVTPGAKHPYELYSRGPNGADAPKEEWISVWDE